MKKVRGILLAILVIITILIQKNTYNDEYLLELSRKRAKEKYPEVHLEDYIEKIWEIGDYTIVYYMIPNILVDGGGGPVFYFDSLSREIVFEGIQY